jgi:hypothetical protein
MSHIVVRGAGILSLVLTLALPAAASAQEDSPSRFRAGGEVTAVDMGASAFTLQPREGDELTIQVTENTVFHSWGGEIEGLEDMQSGMRALVRGWVTEEGDHVARGVAVGDPADRPELERYGGTVSSVVPGQDTFSVELRDGGEMAFQTNDRTRFRSRDGSVDGLEDLKKGMLVRVGALPQEGGGHLALVVLAGNPEDRPGRQADVRRVGRIVSLGHNEMTIETRSGEQITFSVDGSTVYKSRGGTIDSFDDLEEGMIAAVGAKDIGNGKLKAIWVAAGHPRAEAEGRSGQPTEPQPAPDPGADLDA